MTTKAEHRRLARVAELPCIACTRLGLGETPAQVHHIREGRIGRHHGLTIPLCPAHHTGWHFSIHHDKEALLRLLKVGSEFDLLADVNIMLEAT